MNLRPGNGPRITERGNVQWSTRDLLVGSRRDRYRDPTHALRRDELPLSERIICGIVVAILVLGALWISTHLP